MEVISTDFIIRTCATSKRERKTYDSTGVPQCSLHKLFEWVLSLAIPTAAILAQRCRWVHSWCFYHFIFNKERSWRLLPLFSFFQFMDLEFGEKHANWIKFWLWLGSILSFWAQDTHPLSLLLWLKIIVGYCIGRSVTTCNINPRLIVIHRIMWTHLKRCWS